MTDNTGKDRIKSACIQCQKRKKRCDGGKPTCANCSKFKASCQYTERRSRGPGKKNNRVENLETRLKTLESALRLQESAPASAAVDQAVELVQPVQASGSEVNNNGDSSLYSQVAPIEPGRGHVGMRGESQVDLETISLTETNSNPAPAILAAQQISTPAQIISKYSEFTDGIKSAYHWIRGQENRGLNQSLVFARLPTYDQVRSLVEPIVEPLQQYGVVTSTESWVKLLDEQYSADPDRFADNPARWAIVNSFFATAMLNRSTTDFLAEIMPTARSYFQNAFSMFPQLITQGKDVSACEALAAMVMFAQCIADAQLITQITAALTCLVKTLGINRKGYYTSLSPTAIHRHECIFWVAYILEVDAMEKYAISPSLGHEELGTPFEHDAPAPEYTNYQHVSKLDLLRWRAELAIIQRRKYEQLHHIKYHATGGHELSNTVSSMENQLQEWRSRLPGRIWAIDNHFDESDFASSFILLQYAFYNAMSKVHMAVVHAKAAGHTVDDENIFSEQLFADFETRRSWNTSVFSSRDVIAVVVNLAPQPFFQLWGTLCYPFSAVLTLFLAILRNPTTPAAQDNLDRIGSFVNLLKKLANEGFDVQRLWNACIKLHDVASCAIRTSQAEEHSQGQQPDLGRRATFRQLKAIRAKLSKVQDWLQLAQGLLSNLLPLRAEAEEAFSSISGLGTQQGNYGLCVPDLLRSQNDP